MLVIKLTATKIFAIIVVVVVVVIIASVVIAIIIIVETKETFYSGLDSLVFAHRQPTQTV